MMGKNLNWQRYGRELGHWRPTFPQNQKRRNRAMSIVKVKIQTDHVTDDREISQTLHCFADYINEHPSANGLDKPLSMPLYDRNGHKVGECVGIVKTR